MNKQVRKRLGDLLLEVGLLTKDQLEKALDIQKRTGEKLGEVLISEGFVTQQDIIQALEFQLGIPHVVLEKYEIDPDICLLVSENIARRHGLIPIRRESNVLTVAMVDPLNVFAIDDVKIYSGLEVQPVIASLEDINKAIDRYYSKQKAMKAVEEFKKEKSSTLRIHSDDGEEQQSTDEINNAPAVKLINSILEQAVKSRASDIHIEPFEKYIKIRYRIDGQLYEVMRPEIDIMSTISSRIKIIGGMNIAEKRLPQDGRITIQINDKVFDLRVSILPTVFGEKIVIRVVDKKSFIIPKEKLGFDEDDRVKFEKMLLQPHGILLVTGPTGSGKSTTLYSAINQINKPKINIITIEDPVEALIEGVNQVNVNYKTGLTFAAGLRSILRQDPNVIMIGEIRDSETAEIAVRAAITGHLVLSTLHTNDAIGAISRLIDMGIEPFLVASSVVGVIAQRLVKRVCSNCIKEYFANSEELEILGFGKDEKVKLYAGRGCPVCNGTGYKGRQGVYEIMQMTKKHRELINGHRPEDELREASKANGMRTLKDSVKRGVLSGMTTVDEMLRVSCADE